MTIYEYRCPECEHTFEKLVKLNAKPPACPECGAPEVRKLVSAAGFILKGSGWYKDHYGLKGSSGGGSKEGASEGGASKAETSAPDKSAASSSTPSSSTSSASE